MGGMRRLVARALIALAVVSGAGVALAARADAYIYFSSYRSENYHEIDSIIRSENDGSNAQRDFIDLPEDLAVNGDIAGDSQYLYWAGGFGVDYGTMGRANIDGSGSNPLFYNPNDGDVRCVVAVDPPSGLGQHVYYQSPNGHTIARMDLDGTHVDKGFITNGSSYWNTCGLAVDAQHIYWVNKIENNNGSWTTFIGRANHDGTDVHPQFLTIPDHYPSLAVGPNKIYWVDPGAGELGMANLDGSNPNFHVVGLPNYPCGIATDGHHIFWANHNSNTIGRANMDGS